LPATIHKDEDRGENRQPLGSDHPTAGHHGSREPWGCPEPNIVWESQPQTEGRRI